MSYGTRRSALDAARALHRQRARWRGAVVLIYVPLIQRPREALPIGEYKALTGEAPSATLAVPPEPVAAK